MTPLLRIRKDVFGVTQAEMAEIAGVRQATVSRWESGLAEPQRDQLAAIRSEAVRRQLAWDDSWFFVEPGPAEALAS